MAGELNKQSTDHERLSRNAVWGAISTLTLAGATLTTGLMAGVFYAYAVSVSLGLAAQPDAAYVSTMNAINERIQNPLFFASFLGAVPFLLAALAAQYRGPRAGRFWLVVLASVLYLVGGFLLTILVNVPLNNELATVNPDAPARVLAEARATYEGPWNFWNGVRAVFSILAFFALICACLTRRRA